MGVGVTSARGFLAVGAEPFVWSFADEILPPNCLRREFVGVTSLSSAASDCSWAIAFGLAPPPLAPPLPPRPLPRPRPERPRPGAGASSP